MNRMHRTAYSKDERIVDHASQIQLRCGTTCSDKRNMSGESRCVMK
jgi:hypothetical protein